MNKQITLVATDLDGTFLDSQKRVSDINREAINQLKQHGILFGIASGRPTDTIRAMIRQWGIADSVSFIMGMNGGSIYDVRRREKHEYFLLPGTIIIDIINFFEDLDVFFHVLVGSIRYTSKSTEETRRHAELFGETEIETDLRIFLQDRDVNKLILMCDPSYMPVVLERAKQYTDTRTTHYMTADDLLEFVDPHINKGFGIKKLAKHFGVQMEHVLAFGDAPNDALMLRDVGHGVCMVNGSDISKSMADEISDYTNDESGVGRFIEEHILND